MDYTELYKILFIVTLAVAVIIIIIIGLLLRRNFLKTKRAVQLREESKDLNRKLLMVIRAAKMSTWDINIMDRTIDFNFENFTPLQDTGHYTTTIDRYYAALHPDDLEKIQKSYIKILNGEKEFFQENYRVKFPGTSEYRHIESFAIISQKDEAGMPVTLVGASQLVEDD